MVRLWLRKPLKLGVTLPAIYQFLIWLICTGITTNVYPTTEKITAFRRIQTRGIPTLAPSRHMRSCPPGSVEANCCSSFVQTRHSSFDA